MHQYATYAFTPQSEPTFNQMYRDLYTLVDVGKGDWVPQHHDELLRERMKRKMGQLRTKMLKTGEIVGRANDASGGWERQEGYTGEAAGDDVDDVGPEVDGSGEGGDMMLDDDGGGQAGGGAHDPMIHQQHAHAHAHGQLGGQYEPVPEHGGGMGHAQGMPYGMAHQVQQVQQQGQGGYPMMPPSHGGLMGYAGMGGHGHGQGVM